MLSVISGRWREWRPWRDVRPAPRGAARQAGARTGLSGAAGAARAEIMTKRMPHCDTPQTPLVLDRLHSRSKARRYRMALREWPVRGPSEDQQGLLGGQSF